MAPDLKISILLAVAAVHVVLLTCLSSRHGRITRAALGRFFLWATSAMYFPLISYVLSHLTKYLSELAKNGSGGETNMLITLVILVESLKSNTDMAALSVAAVASAPAGRDDIDSQKIRPPMLRLAYSFWVAGLVVCNMLLETRVYIGLPNTKKRDRIEFETYLLGIFLLWALGAGKMVLRFAASRHASGSFALGRNAQLIDGYMAQLQEGGYMEEAVPRLILTGEKNQDVEEIPQGYRVKHSALQDRSSGLVTLDKVWSSGMSPELKDLCLSFSLFKCLRRRFAGYRLATEAGSTWAFRFVCDGLLGQENDHGRMFRVIADELAFASDFYYSPLPVASLGTWPAALHFVLSLLLFALICCLFIVLALGISYGATIGGFDNTYPDFLVLLIVILLLTLVIASIEMSEMITHVRSNWTKISIVAYSINCSRRPRMICSYLLRCKPPRQWQCWKDEIGQSLLLKPLLPMENGYEALIKVSPEVKCAILRSLRSGGGQLSNGVATVQRQCPHITWACHGGVTTNTDAILVWYIATSLFEIKFSSIAATPATKMVVANSLSRYCTYLVARAPDLLPDNAAWTKRRYQQVKKCVETVCSRRSGAKSGPCLYSQLIESFGNDDSHEVLKMGSRLGNQLVEEAERQRDQNQRHKQEECVEAVWELLAEFWSEMILYLAPSDNVKAHIKALQRGGELITLLWVLLLHAGITTRPGVNVPEP